MYGMTEHNLSAKSRYAIYDGFNDRYYFTDKTAALKKAYALVKKTPIISVYEIRKGSLTYILIGKVVRDVGSRGEYAKWVPKIGKSSVLYSSGRLKPHKIKLAPFGL